MHREKRQFRSRKTRKKALRLREHREQTSAPVSMKDIPIVDPVAAAVALMMAQFNRRRTP